MEIEQTRVIVAYFFTHVVGGSAVEMVRRPLEKLVLSVDLSCFGVFDSEFSYRFDKRAGGHFVTSLKVSIINKFHLI